VSAVSQFSHRLIRNPGHEHAGPRAHRDKMRHNQPTNIAREPARAKVIGTLEFVWQAGNTTPRQRFTLGWPLFTGLQMISLNINGKTQAINVDPDTPLLWVLREHVGLTGTKYGCGIAQCGACTVHIDGVAMRSCSVPASLG
jgi:hypothetical protein